MNEVGGLSQIFPVSLVLTLEAVKLRHIESPLAIAQAVQKLHVVLEELHLFHIPETIFHNFEVKCVGS